MDARRLLTRAYLAALAGKPAFRWPWALAIAAAVLALATLAEPPPQRLRTLVAVVTLAAA